MHIGYVANNRFPSERAHMTQIVHMCNAFAENGHTVTLIVTDRETKITEAPEVFFGVPLHFALVRVSVPDIAGRSPKIPAFLHPYLFLIQQIVFVWGVCRVARERRCTHLYGRDEVILLFITRFSRVPVIWESHEAKFTYIARALLKAVNRVVVISEGILNFYIAHGVSRAKMHVAHDAVDDRFFAPLVSKEEAQKTLGFASEKPLVLYIGGLDMWKGVDTLLACTTKSDSFIVGIIGGTEKEILKMRAEYPQVSFFGSRPYRDLPLYQQAGDILVIPNTAKNALSSEYTSPLKLFSYMTAQKPIIASRIPSIQNIVSDEEVYFCNPDDVQNLRNVILSALQSPDVSLRKALRAYEKGKQYTWTKRAHDIVDFMNT